MRVGISSACFYPNVNTEDSLDIIKAAGFDICEIFLEADCEFEEDYLVEMKANADSLGIDIYSVHPFSVGFEPFLFDRYKRRRMDMEKKFRRVCRAAQILGAKCYVFHGLRKMNPFPNIKETAEGMDGLCRIASEYGIKLAWENVAWCMSASPEFMNMVKQEMEEEIYFTLDIKQAIRAGREPQEYLDVYGENIINFHINDASSKSSCLLPGRGEVDLKSIINKVQSINRDAPYLIEVYDENFDGIGSLKEARRFIEGIGD